MSMRAVIFDFGGVIVRTEHQAGRLKWAERLGVPPEVLYAAVFDSEAAAQASVGKAPADAIWAHVAATFVLDDAALAQLRTDFFAGDLRDDVLVAYIRALRPAYRTGILSNAWSDGRHIIAEHFGLRDAVDDIVISAEAGIAKPDPRIFALATERLGVRPDETVFVDDFVRNVTAAQAFGMQAVHFRNTPQALAEIAAILHVPTPQQV